MPAELDYYNTNLLTKYPFSDSNTDDALTPIADNWFADIVFFLFTNNTKSVYLSSLTILADTTAIFIFSDKDTEIAILTASFSTSSIVDNTIPTNSSFLSYSTSTAAVKFVFGPGFIPLLSTDLNATYTSEQSLLCSSATILNVPKVETLNILNNYPTTAVHSYNSSTPQILMSYRYNTVANDLSNNMVIDVGAEIGAGLLPCPEISSTRNLYTINLQEPNTAGNLFFVPSPCYSLSLLNSTDIALYGTNSDTATYPDSLYSYLNFNIPSQSPYPEIYDALSVGHSFLLVNNCVPKCSPDSLNAFAYYLNRVYNGVSEVFDYAGSANQTTGTGNTLSGLHTFTASSFTTTYPAQSGFIKYFHEGKNISFQVNSMTPPQVYTIASVIDANNITLTTSFTTNIIGALFAVDDLGLFQKIDNAIEYYNSTVYPVVATPNAQILFNTSEGDDEFGNFGTFLSLICVIYNPSDFPVTFTVGQTPIGSISMLPGTEKVRYEGDVVFNTNTGTVTCKTYATYEAVYFIPCGPLTASLDIVISGIWQMITSDLSGGTQNISVVSAECPPVITSATSVTVSADTSFCYQITATGSASSVYFDTSTLPSWAITNTTIPTTCNISGITDLVDAFYSVFMTVSNNDGGYVSFLLNINVVATPIVYPTNQTAQLYAAFVYQVPATGSPSSYSMSGLPPGLSYNSTTGFISGVPNTLGSYDVIASATNITGTGHATFTIDVTEGTPVVTSAATAYGTQGNPFSYQITATNNPTSFAIFPTSFSGSLAGIFFDATYGLIYGIPSSYGSGSVTVYATNALPATGSESLTIHISQSTPVITSSQLSVGSRGHPFTYTLTAKNNPTSFTVVGIPSWATLSTTVVMNDTISGTPSATGTYSISAHGTNSAGNGPTVTIDLQIF